MNDLHSLKIDKMKVEILTMDGNYIRFKCVLGVVTPTVDNPIFIISTAEEEITFPMCNIKYCKEIH